MALHDDAVQPQEDAAIRFTDVHLLAQPGESPLRKHVADARHQRSAHGSSQILSKLPDGSLRGLQRDIAREALGYHHVDRALADVVALDEAAVLQRSQSD